ncbi:protein eyes shut homolog isoform X2 [Actinia tenebrosa]|uniref:Protein eyes shut homolog isoform X2 n=1 Tax=Actinia tenebrosa TaxID=6105 RepID=A0A6P8HPY8_ACTTE|nr:protein eyes shut homolog isoform X2 [Actinia tenebrosa]
MGVSKLHMLLRRTNILYLGMLLLFCFVPCGVLAQNSTVAPTNNSEIANVACPSGNECFSTEYRNVTVELGYNGQVCPGHTPQDCYNENDPRGFIAGPRQYPAIIYQGDKLIVKSSEKYDFAVKLYNVSKRGFDLCDFKNASPVISDLTRLPFEVPARFIAATGIKYFIAESDNMIIQCQFGLKLEVNVRSRDSCLSQPPSNNNVCSSKGLCAVSGKFFTFNASCVCDTGYSGAYCGERGSCHAKLNPCQNGATCIDKKSGLQDDYNCTCAPGFTGRNCTENVTISSSAVAYTSVMATTVGKSSVVSDVQTSTLGTTHLLTYSSTVRQTVSLSSVTSSEFTTSYATSSSVPLESISTVSQSIFTGSLVPSSYFSLSSSFTLVPSISAKDSVSLTTHTSSITKNQTSSSSVSSLVVTVKTSKVESLSTSSFSTKSLSASTTVLPVSTPEVFQTTSVYNSPSLNTTSSMISTVQVLSTTSSMPSSVISVAATSSVTTKVASTSHLLTMEPSVTTTTVTSSDVPTSSLTPQSTSSILSSSSIKPSSSSILPLTSSILESISSVGPTTSSSSQVIPPSITLSSQIIPSTMTFSSTVMMSSVYPTMPPTFPPTTIPLKDQTCKNNPCNNGTCRDVPDQYGLNFTCQCPKPTYGPRCSTDFTLHFPRFSSSSYLVHKPIAFSAGFNKIVITFKTTATNGLLFYSSHSIYKDFIQLYITDGKLEYRFDPGDYLCVITSKVSVNTGVIVTAVVTYDSRNKQGSLQVDNHPRQNKTSRGKMVGIGLYNDWYVGGLPPGKRIGSNDGGQATPNLVGCIKDIELNGDQIGFTEANDWNDISECDTPCNGTHKPCQNNGQCIPDTNDPHDYECNCTHGFEGKNCKNASVCSGDPCKGGLCVIGKSAANTSRVCLCPFGRGGIECENELSIMTPTFTMAYNYSSFIQYQKPTLSGAYFEITLQFKINPNSTAWNNALLMFSGQNQYQGKGDDFIALGINNSKVLLQYNLGSGIANIESDPIDTTREWHFLTAGRNGKEGYLYLDNNGVKRGSSPGQLTGLNLYSPLYIGGVPDLSELPTDVLFKRGFEGSIANGAVKFGVSQPVIPLLTSQSNSSSHSQWAVIAGRNVGDEGYNNCNTSNPCQNNGTCTQIGAAIVCSCVHGWKGMYCASQEIPCVNHNPCAVNSTCREMNNKAVCDCPLGKTGDTCSNAISIQTPHFKENSYMAFTPTALNIRLNANIVIKFISYNGNGLLFYVAHKITAQNGDFLSVSLHNGFVQYRYDLGSGINPIQSQKNITFNTEHTVTITRNQQTGALKVDDDVAISTTSPGKAVALDASSNFYLGGVPQLSLVNPSAVADVKSLRDFVGCVTSLTINGVPLKLTETRAVEGRNIDNCPAISDSNLA